MSIGTCASDIASREAISNASREQAAATIEIHVRIRNVYGNELVYPACDTSKALAELAGHKTFTAQDMRIIKSLGYDFKVETPLLSVGG